MAVLHIVNKSPFDRPSLDTCLRLATAGSAILFIEDGIYAAMANSATSEKVTQSLAKHTVYALQPDLQARGIDPEKIIKGISLVDYDGFVKLTTEYEQTQSWL